MKKKLVIIISALTILILVLLILCLKYISFGITTYEMPNSGITLEIPKLSIFKEECCMYSASFKTFRSKSVVQKELDNIINKYEKKICNHRIIYYDKKHDITITEYGVESGKLMTNFYIVYDKGMPTNSECNRVTDITKIEYRYYPIPDDIPRELKVWYQYLNSNGKKYDVYANWTGCLAIKPGTRLDDNHYQYFEGMLDASYMSMGMLIEFLEYQVNNNLATKEIHDDGEATLYKNKDFSLLKCNTSSGNQDVYISDQLEYKEEYCK